MNLYLDIDGVLVGRDGVLPNNLDEFLAYVTQKYNCFWLTTHCQGDLINIRRHLVSRWPAHLLTYIDNIKPTKWGRIKTDAIDFSREFIWLDDYIFELDWRVLEKHNREHCAIQVNVNENPNDLWGLVGKEL